MAHHRGRAILSRASAGRHLRLAIAELIEPYHLERHHQGLDSQLITAPPPAVTRANDSSPVARRERLGGLLNYYHRRAA